MKLGSVTVVGVSTGVRVRGYLLGLDMPDARERIKSEHEQAVEYISAFGGLPSTEPSPACSTRHIDTFE